VTALKYVKLSTVHISRDYFPRSIRLLIKPRIETGYKHCAVTIARRAARCFRLASQGFAEACCPGSGTVHRHQPGKPRKAFAHRLGKIAWEDIPRRRCQSVAKSDYDNNFTASARATALVPPAKARPDPHSRMNNNPFSGPK